MGNDWIGLAGLAITVITFLLSYLLDKHNKKKQKLLASRVFVDVEMVRATVSLQEFYPNQIKNIHPFSCDKTARSKNSEAFFIKLKNPSIEPLRNVHVYLYSTDNYVKDKKTEYSQVIPQIQNNEWCMILLPQVFSSFPGSAGLAGLIDGTGVQFSESLTYTRIEYLSSENENLEVEMFYDGKIRHKVNSKVVSSFVLNGIHTYA